MGLISWWRNRKQRKKEAMALKAKEAFKKEYVLKFGINMGRDIETLKDMVNVTGKKYLQEVKLLMASTGNGEYLSDKITSEDIPKLIMNVYISLSEDYLNILEIYYGNRDNIMKYISLLINEICIEILMVNKHKIDSMNPAYRNKK